MSLEDNSVSHSDDQPRGNRSLASSARLEDTPSATEGFTANQGPFQVSQHNNTDQPIEVVPASYDAGNLHHRHPYGVEELNTVPGTFTSNGNVGAPKSQTVEDGRDNNSAESASVDTAWSESTIVPRRNLGFVQITSLMLNGTIGSGIFITPGYVLALTRSKRIALVLWALGGVYTALRYVACNVLEGYN